MYQAELRGKLSSRIERMEDVLTSNVFSFFKYSTREIFLKGYLKILGFDVSDKEAKEAEFIFWPHFEENTEPDLVIIVGNYYLLIEAKYFSDFGGETNKTKAQLIREIEGGKLDAKNYGKDFVLIAITADSYYKETKFQAITSDSKPHFKWTNWQLVASLLKKQQGQTYTFDNLVSRPARRTAGRGKSLLLTCFGIKPFPFAPILSLPTKLSSAFALIHHPIRLFPKS